MKKTNLKELDSLKRKIRQSNATTVDQILTTLQTCYLGTFAEEFPNTLFSHDHIERLSIEERIILGKFATQMNSYYETFYDAFNQKIDNQTKAIEESEEQQGKKLEKLKYNMGLTAEFCLQGLYDEKIFLKNITELFSVLRTSEPVDKVEIFLELFTLYGYDFLGKKPRSWGDLKNVETEIPPPILPYSSFWIKETISLIESLFRRFTDSYISNSKSLLKLKNLKEKMMAKGIKIPEDVTNSMKNQIDRAVQLYKW